MAALKADWHKIGPMPTDSDLEERLGRVKHKNDHPKADEAVWSEFSAANADVYIAAEREFFQQLDKQIN